MNTAPAAFGPLSHGTTAERPLLIVAALLLASFVVGFDTRVFAVGLPDLRGAFGLGVDEASWLSTAANAPQILIASAVAWLVTVFGVRRIMIPCSFVYAIVSLLIPFVHDGTALMILHIIRALLLGVFIPATIMVIFRNLQPKYWLYGLAIYALRIPLSQNLGFALVGVYGDYLGWQWLYWQDVIISPLIALLLIFGAPREALNTELLKDADWGGMLLLGSSMTMIYVALDQGNRLDWLASGVVTSLLTGGLVLGAGFLLNESLVQRPWAHASAILSRNLGLGFGVISAFTFSSAAGSIVIPGYLQNVAGLRPVEISDLYLTSAVLPAFAFIAIAALILRMSDPRYCMILGLIAIAAGSLFGAQLTPQWAPSNFMIVVLLYTLGQAFTFLAAIVYLIANSDPKRSTAASAYIQVVRLGSAELATSQLSTWIRQREQFHSNVLGSPIAMSNPSFSGAVRKLEAIFGLSPRGAAEAIATVSGQIKAQANVLAYADGFTIAFWFSLLGLLLVVFMGAAPMGPLHPSFHRKPVAPPQGTVT